MSAIKKEISSATLFAEIKLQRAVHKGSFLLVEGDTDARLYGQFIDGGRCNIVNCINKDNVQNTILLLDENQFCGAIGLVDGDFADISNDNVPSSNIVRTQGNDTEVMIVDSPALDKVLLHYGSEQKIRAICANRNTTIKHILAAEAAKIGVIRLASKRREWNLKFNGMRYQFTNNAECSVDGASAARHILARSGANAPTIVELQDECAAITALGHDNLLLSSGHDYVRILARALKRDIGTNNTFETDSSELEKVLRIAYERSYFSETTTSEAIRNWETQNVPYIVLLA
ncbi:DUF4435 domain-containing protein [Ochrobactrum sp. AN78]|uniref:DUF4435 domain-containing protein n=1 Tax=Ochrobactrum sp. AN78 TaxID=3039853 RepID=UPI002989BFBE|nr:DUF4435 domain-containing protein [Ochrobactrum sp. AN78]MDH7790181.1 hypothetical protein [Ochrobactrum sp. AN78]